MRATIAVKGREGSDLSVLQYHSRIRWGWMGLEKVSISWKIGTRLPNGLASGAMLSVASEW